jgi:hypothetical protein
MSIYIRPYADFAFLTPFQAYIKQFNDITLINLGFLYVSTMITIQFNSIYDIHDVFLS